MGIRGMIEVGIEVVRLSQIYETEPFETVPQPSYLNMVAAVCTNDRADPEDLLLCLMKVETSLGRTREVVGGPRVIDLDLLLFDNQIRDTALLKLPHPRLHRRRFVLVPLVELAPNLVHPTLNQPLHKILADLEDDSRVELWSP